MLHELSVDQAFPAGGHDELLELSQRHLGLGQLKRRHVHDVLRGLVDLRIVIGVLAGTAEEHIALRANQAGTHAEAASR